MVQLGIGLMILSLALKATDVGLDISDLIVPTCVIMLTLIICRD